MVSTHKKKHQNKALLSRLNESLNACVFNHNTQVGVTEGEIARPQNDGLDENFGSETLGENSASCNQVLGRDIANRVRKETASVVAAVENRIMRS